MRSTMVRQVRPTTSRSLGMDEHSTPRKSGWPSLPRSRPRIPPGLPLKNLNGVEGTTGTVSTGTGILSPTVEPDLARVVEVLDRHGVEYLIVGGSAARVYGAQRVTRDSDCLILQARENLESLAHALQELNARLRVEGMTDEEAATLPVRLDARALERMQITNWRTDAGDLDVMVDMPDRNGNRRRYEDLAGNAKRIFYGQISIRVAGLEDIIASKEWANRPKDRDALPELHALAALSRSTEPAVHPPPMGPVRRPPGRRL